jgi:ATP-dependent RNA helicase RhlE
MSFDSLGLSARAVQNATRAGFVTPTPIQVAAIPVALAGRDLLGCAQTGTGKTAAFVLPTLERLAADPNATALVLAPTRELAQQIADTVRILSGGTARVATILGGASMSQQMHSLRGAPQWIIATPGRLIDHIERATARMGSVRVLVLDEADRMLDMGFAPQLRRIL